MQNQVLFDKHVKSLTFLFSLDQHLTNLIVHKSVFRNKLIDYLLRKAVFLKTIILHLLLLFSKPFNPSA